MIRYTLVNRVTDSGLPYSVKTGLVRMLWPNPYSKYEIDKKAIFIHIPKNGGTAVRRHLGLNKGGHDRAIWYKMYDKKKFKKYLKFSVVRNPWSRLVSAYFYLTQGRGHETTMKWVRKNLSGYESFDDFVMSLKDEKTRRKITSWVHFMPQVNWISNENGKNCMDNTIRLENIEEEIKVLHKKLDVVEGLEKKNKSKHDSYKKYYNKKTKKVVKKVYKRDVEMLGYEY